MDDPRDKPGGYNAFFLFDCSQAKQPYKKCITFDRFFYIKSIYGIVFP